MRFLVSVFAFAAEYAEFSVCLICVSLRLSLAHCQETRQSECNKSVHSAHTQRQFVVKTAEEK